MTRINIDIRGGIDSARDLIAFQEIAMTRNFSIKQYRIEMAACLAAVLAAPAQANLTGSMNVSLTLENGCIVSGSSSPLNAVDFGTMNFGTAPTLFAVNLQAQSLISGSPVQLQCSSGANLSILVGNGQNLSGGVRRLASAGNYVQYRLFTQANGAGTEYVAGANALDLSASVPGGGGTFSLPIRGLIAPQANLVAGSYSDVVSITLTF